MSLRTLEMARKLQETGFTPPQAECIVEQTMVAIHESNLVTKPFLTVELAKLEANLGKNIALEIARLERNMFQQEKNIADKFSQLEKSVSAEITRVDENILRLEKNMSERFSQQEKSFSERFSQQEKSFSDRLSQQEKSLSDRLSQQEKSFSDRLSQHEKITADRFSRLEREIDQLGNKWLRWVFGIQLCFFSLSMGSILGLIYFLHSK